MINIYRKSKKDNWEVDISLTEWMEILSLPKVLNDKNLMYALEKWYLEPNSIASCKYLAYKYNKSPNFFSVQNVKLGKIAVKYLNRFRLVNTNGKETFWGISWIEIGRNDNAWVMQLRPELINAIKTLNLFQLKNDNLNVKEALQYQDLSKEDKFEYLYEMQPKAEKHIRTNELYQRSILASKRALSHAGFICEVNAAHETFPRMADGLPYMEPHHLIPIKYSDNFDVSIDVPENIVSLCSICHDRIHYGADRKELIEFLYNLRKNDLEKIGITIMLEELLRMYNINI